MILCCFHSLISTRTFRKALTASVDSCAEIKSAPSVAEPFVAEFGGRCRKARHGVWVNWFPENAPLCSPVVVSDNNNNEYLERPTGSKRLHVLYKYILSKFSAYNMNAHTHSHTHRDSHTHAPAHTVTQTHTHTPVSYTHLTLPTRTGV